MYYAKQVSPEYQQDDLFYQYKDSKGHYELGLNDDYYTNNVIIYGNKEFKDLTTKEFDKLLKIDWYEWENLDQYGFGNMSDYLNFYFKKTNGKNYSPKEVKKWKELLENHCYVEQIIEEALQLITGQKWRKETIRGYMQREWQTIYVNSLVSDKAVNYLEMCYFNTGSEFIVYESEEDYENENGYSIYLDCCDKSDIAEYLGCEESDLKVFKYVGYHKVSDYEEM